jgi:hypothetical protein
MFLKCFIVLKNILLDGKMGEVFTDGTSMLGCKSGFHTLIKTVSKNVIGIHYIIHCHMLAVKTLSVLK